VGVANFAVIQTKLLLAILVMFFIAPLVIALWRLSRAPGDAIREAWDWSLVAKSTLAFTLAFNAQFFVQELLLVVPKALTPGLKPTLFHNNHTWSGFHPLVELLQGTGALGTILVGLVCTAWLLRRPPRGDAARLVLCWLALLGFLSALPQVVIGNFLEGNDVGRAMSHLGWTANGKFAAAVIALVAMAAICWWLAPRLLSSAAAWESRRAHPRLAAQTCVVPLLIALPLIAAFRVPNAPIEVLLPPAVDGLIAAVWITAASYFGRSAPAAAKRASMTPLVLAVITAFAIFQFVLRPGIPFY
jgi:hypothetical protein